MSKLMKCVLCSFFYLLSTFEATLLELIFTTVKSHSLNAVPPNYKQNLTALKELEVY